MEMMISLGLGTFLFLVVAGFSSASMKSFLGMTNHLSFEEKMADIKLLLSSAKECSLNLSGKSFTMADPSGIVMADITEHNAANQPINAVIKMNQRAEGLTIQDIRLLPIAFLGQSLIASEIVVTAEGGHQVLERRLPLMVQTQNGIIKQCWMRGTRSQALMNRICEKTSNGEFDSYDENTGQCVFGFTANGFEGNLSSAQCPKDFRPLKQNDKISCRAKFPRNFDDTGTRTSVLMEDGSTKSFGRPPFMSGLNKDDSCSCAYATDLAPDLRSASICMIRCTK